MLTVISLGAGVQSTTMALMAAHGEITPMPDCAIFADTQAEPQSVYQHLDWLRSANVLPFPVHVVTRGNLAQHGLELHISRRTGKQYQRNLIPLFMRAKDGSKGILNRKCTAEYKVREIIKKVRKLANGELVSQWIGISSDEAMRMKPSMVDGITNRWPLIEMGIARHDCLKWMEKNGYPKPPRSACVFCPYHSDREWRRLRDEEPAEFIRAVAWERKMQAANAEDQTAKGVPFLHSSLVPLDKVDLRTDAEIGQLDLFNNECEGMCGV